mmetsp:Transcript_36014/g.110395  ORF Transcript_36014/g.110395 Transcript_36014/m.110395 type:complete len:112 (+) Transcript_36014:81-416(+)
MARLRALTRTLERRLVERPIPPSHRPPTGGGLRLTNALRPPLPLPPRRLSPPGLDPHPAPTRRLAPPRLGIGWCGAREHVAREEKAECASGVRAEGSVHVCSADGSGRQTP